MNVIEFPSPTERALTVSQGAGPPHRTETIRPAPGGLTGALFSPSDGVLPGGDNQDLRTYLAECHEKKTNCFGDDDIFVNALGRGIDAAGLAIQQGHAFDMGCISYDDLVRRQTPQEFWKDLRLPYPSTPLLIALDGVPHLFACSSDDNGRMIEVIVAAYIGDPTCRYPNLLPILLGVALVPVHQEADSEPMTVVNTKASPEEIRQLTGWVGLTFTLLGLVSDARIPLRHEQIPDKINAKRLKRGKPPLTDVWRLDLHAPYVTPVTATKAQKAHGRGTHASPVAHDRRGHVRKLSSGRTTFVRSCTVGSFSKNLRTRDAYVTGRTTSWPPTTR